MSDEILIQNLGEGRLSEIKENKKALLIGCYSKSNLKDECHIHLEELHSLSDTYGIETIQTIPVHLRRFEPSTFIGKGKVEEIENLIKEKDIGIVVFDDEIAPHQQKNLEKAFKTVVIDRTELILGVFAIHAKTKEAKLQISLAGLKYQLPRLKRMWTHLSRQRVSGSSGGYLKGEGEKQIEIDRQIVKDKIAKLQKKLEDVKKQRAIQRQQRYKTNIPTFAIIGYTNVGKSTLLNALTGAGVLVEDKLFATLDTTTRKYTLPNNQKVLLIDTVGFIRKIPHQLVAAFKSTLEESTFSDILIHLIDISNPEAIHQAEDSIEVLKELKADEKPIITVFNKIDEVEDRSNILKLKLKYPKTVEISALKKIGFDDLFSLMIEEIKKLRKTFKLKIPQSHYALVSKIMKEGRIIEQEYEDNYIVLEAEIPTSLEKDVEEFKLL